MKRISPWLWLFLVVTAWHTWRGANGDAFIFAIASLLIAIDSIRPSLLGTSHRPQFPFLNVLAAGALLVFVMAFTPLASDITQLSVLALGGLAFVMARSHTHARIRPGLTVQQRTAIHGWLAVTVFLLLVEFGAYVAATISGSDDRFPTITVLVDPALTHVWGRAVFACVWLWGGWSLMTVRPGADRK